MLSQGRPGSLRVFVVLILLAAGFPLGDAPPVRPVLAANATVGTGTPASCTPAVLQQALTLVQTTGGGNIDFDCGSAPHTIVITATLQITTGVGFDGGDLGDITLSGGDVRPVFNVPLGGDLGLFDMVVSHGVISDGAGGCIFSFSSVVFIQRTLIHSCRAGPPVLSGQASPTVVGGSSSEGGAIFSGNGALYVIDSQVLSSTAELGGGIRATGYLEISGSRLAGNHGVSFGGAVQSFGTLAVANSLIEHNLSSRGGGLWTSIGSQTTIANSTFYSNTAGFDGGGLESRGALTLTQVSLLENVAGNIGGGLNAYDGTASLNQVTVAGNRAAWFGGGLYAEHALVAVDTHFVNNTGAGSGGGAYANDDLSMTGGSFQNNLCAGGTCSGGGVYVSQAAILTATVFISNTAAGAGGAVFFGGLTQTGGRFENNHCTRPDCSGGGFYASGPVTLKNVDILSNTSGAAGGGVTAFGPVTLIGGLFQGNHCLATLCSGGGLSANAAVTLTGTRFITNSATKFGGAAFLGGPSRLVNALFARNTAGTGGAALYLVGVGQTSLLHLTLAGPAPAGQAAILVANGSVGITNTIIASHTVGISRTSTLVFEDYNLFFDVPTPTFGGVTSGGHSFSGDPAFAGPSADDFHLRANSNAINGGVNAGVFVDFDGDPRPVNAGFDIGFDEFFLRRLFLPPILR